MPHHAPHPATPFQAHDHGACLTSGLAAAEARCAEDGLRLTPARRRALELLLSGHRAMGAYEVLEGLAADGLGSQPPAAYRALEFLTQHGLAHRIERLNAYVACLHPGQPHNPAFLICRACHGVEEAPATEARAAFGAAAAASGFRVEGLVIEALGLCPACAGDDDADAAGSSGNAEATVGTVAGRDADARNGAGAGGGARGRVDARTSDTTPTAPAGGPRA